MSRVQVGFSQRVQLDWLDCTARLALAGKPRTDIEQSLQHLLQERLSVGGTAKRGNREKAVTILLRTWVTVPERLRQFRDEGLALLRELESGERLAIHWGMTMAAYPFWGMVAETTGRLLRLQGTVGAAQVQRRLRETLGERETVARAARRVLRAFMDWGVLEETVCKGVYSRAALRHVVDKRLAIWLIEASLRARGNKSAVLRTILDNPALFPFEVAPPSAQDVASTRRLEIVRHDNDEGLVLLKDENSKGNPGG